MYFVVCAFIALNLFPKHCLLKEAIKSSMLVTYIRLSRDLHDKTFSALSENLSFQ